MTDDGDESENGELYAAQRARVAYLETLGLPARHPWGLLGYQQQRAWLAAARAARNPLPVPVQPQGSAKAARDTATAVLGRVRQQDATGG